MKHYCKRLLPHFSRVQSHPRLQIFGARLKTPHLWHLNRHAVAGGVALGLFCAFVPIPLQMVPAAALAIWLRVNLPVSVLLVWITNPITIPPIFYLAYRLGVFLLGTPLEDTVHWQFSMEWLGRAFNTIWPPLLFGALVMGTFSALAGYAAVHWLWRIQVRRAWRRRQERRLPGLRKLYPEK